jgi:hypothetical protein
LISGFDRGGARPNRCTDLVGPGGPAWLAEFDPDDRAEALSEIRNAVVLTMISEDPDPLRNVLHAWATTAAVMRDPLRRDVHTGPGDEFDYIEPDPP